MAPNRKNVNALVETLSSNELESLQHAVQPKPTSTFLPLTHPKEQHQEKQQEQQQPPQPIESASYWDWPSDIQEETSGVLSTANIESNLMAYSNIHNNPHLNSNGNSNSNCNCNITDEQYCMQIRAHDDYWADQQEEEQQEPNKAPVTKPQHVVLESSYWNWPAEQDSKKATIDRILAEEKAFQLVSGTATEKTLVAQPPSTVESQYVHTTKESNHPYWLWESAGIAAHTLDAAHPNTNYWDWHQEKTSNKNQTVQAFLEYEAARQMLMADNVVQQLLQSSQKKPCESACTNPESSKDYDYWSWNETYGDRYWEEVPRPAAVAATGKGYWDW